MLDKIEIEVFFLQLVFIMSIQLYMYSWYECTYGLFRCCTGDYLGVTEGQVLVSSGFVTDPYLDNCDQLDYSHFPQYMDAVNRFGIAEHSGSLWIDVSLINSGGNCCLQIGRDCGRKNDGQRRGICVLSRSVSHSDETASMLPEFIAYCTKTFKKSFTLTRLQIRLRLLKNGSV